MNGSMVKIYACCDNQAGVFFCNGERQMIIKSKENQMKIKYECHNNNCSYPGAIRFEIEFDQEAIMDQNNLAAIFCPFCKKKMTLPSAESMVDDLPVK